VGHVARVNSRRVHDLGGETWRRKMTWNT